MPGGEGVAAAGRVHDVLDRDPRHDLLHQVAVLVEPVGHAAALVQRDADRLHPVPQAVLGELGQLSVGRSARRRRGARSVDLATGTSCSPASSRFILRRSMCGSHASRSTHRRRLRSPPMTSVLVGPCASSRTVPALWLLDVGQRRLPDLVVGDRHADERVGVQRELDVRAA